MKIKTFWFECYQHFWVKKLCQTLKKKRSIGMRHSRGHLAFFCLRSSVIDWVCSNSQTSNFFKFQIFSNFKFCFLIVAETRSEQGGWRHKIDCELSSSSTFPTIFLWHPTKTSDQIDRAEKTNRWWKAGNYPFILECAVIGI